jgi:organic hydroperoxide reductase OsmC/OhrA
MIELVWDAAGRGTATAPSGASGTVGEEADYSPSDLVAMAVASCYMRTLLKLVEDAGLTLLSFAATAEFMPADATGPPRVRMRAFLVSPPSAAQALERLVGQARLESDVCRLLGDAVLVEHDIRILPPDAES